MDGAFYNDTREPFIGADITAVTLVTTFKALAPPSNYPVFGGQYFARIGKKIRIRAFGRMTTALTPGNVQFGILYGTGADNNGVNVVQTAAVALAASQTSLSWWAEFTIHCRSLGATGTLFGTGIVHTNVALILSTAQPLLAPASLAAVSAACDLTAALIPSLQILRSGSTVETAQVHDLDVTALN